MKEEKSREKMYNYVKRKKKLFLSETIQFLLWESIIDVSAYFVFFVTFDYLRPIV